MVDLRHHHRGTSIVIEQPTEPPRGWTTRGWMRGAPAAGWTANGARDEPALHRLLGGAPLVVAARLVVVSLVVGALLMWLDIRPVDVYRELSDLGARLWALGFRSVRDFGAYIVAGAIIVVPVWLVLRLFSYRGR